MKQDETRSSVPSIPRPEVLHDAPLFAGLEDGFWSPSSLVRPDKEATAKHEVKKKTQPKKSASHHQTHASSDIVRAEDPPTALFFSITDMCALLSISRATLVRMDKNNAIPGRVKLGGSVRYHRETIKSWLADLVKSG